MAEAIEYCDRCARLVPPSELGNALRGATGVVCRACAAAMSPEEHAAFAPALRPSSPSPHHRGASGTGRRPAVRDDASLPRAEGGRRAPVGLTIAATLAGMIGGVAAVVVFMAGDDGKGAAAPTPTGGPPATPPAVAAPEVPAAPVATPPAAPGRDGPAPAAPSVERRIAEIEAMVEPSLGRYDEIRKALQEIVGADADGGGPASARALLARVDALYEELAEASLESARQTASGLASRNDWSGAERALRSVAERYSSGTWLDAKGRAEIDEALAALSRKRDEGARAALDVARGALDRDDLRGAREALRSSEGWRDDDRRAADEILARARAREEALRTQPPLATSPQAEAAPAASAVGGPGAPVAGGPPRCAVYEPFDYPAGKPVASQGGTSDMGFEGPWQRGTEIVSKTMEWGGLPTAGNCIAATRNYDAYRAISSAALRDAGLLEDGATIWISFLMSVEGANLTNVDMNLALASKPFTFYVLKKYSQRMELEEGGDGIGIAYVNRSVRASVWTGGKRQPAEESTQKFDAGPDSLALVAAKITWGRAGAPDTIEVHAPDRGLDPGPVVSRASADLDQKGFTVLGIQMKEEHTHVDEIRIGATYSDVTSDTIAKLLNGLSVEDVAGVVERDGYRLSLGVMKGFAERFDAAKVVAKKLATVGDAFAASSSFDASVRRQLSAAEGYVFASKTGFASSRTTVAAALKSVPRALAREKPEVVRVCIGCADVARNAAPADFREGLRDLAGVMIEAGSIPVLHTLPVRTITVPTDKKERDAADAATKAQYALSEAVGAYNAAISGVASEKGVPLVDAWHIVNTGPTAHQRYFAAGGGLNREGYEAVNARFLKLYRILERGIAGRVVPPPPAGDGADRGAAVAASGGRVKRLF